MSLEAYWRDQAAANDRRIAALETENTKLKTDVAELRQTIEHLRGLKRPIQSSPSICPHCDPMNQPGRGWGA